MADTEESNRSEKLNIYMMNVWDECTGSMHWMNLLDECKNQCVAVNVIGNE